MACQAIEAHPPDIVIEGQGQQVGDGGPKGLKDRFRADLGTGQQNHVNGPELMVPMGSRLATRGATPLTTGRRAIG